MAAYNKFQQFVEDLTKKVHNLSADTLKVALTNSAPLAANSVLADLTEIDYTYCSARTLTITSCEQTSGTVKLIIEDLNLAASGGAVGPFRYVVIYNDTPSSPADPLICWFDYGSSITLNDGEDIDLDFDGTEGLLQIA